MKLSWQQRQIVDRLEDPRGCAEDPDGVCMRDLHWCYNYTARISDLRAKGFLINQRTVHGSHRHYALAGVPIAHGPSRAVAQPVAPVPPVVSAKPTAQTELLDVQRVGDSVFYNTRESSGT